MSTREVVKVTGKSIAAFYERLQPGVRIECIGNTFRPEAVGISATVMAANRSTIDLRLEDGKPGAIFVPRKVGSVYEITTDSITYESTKRGGHAVTWRIIAEPDHG